MCERWTGAGRTRVDCPVTLYVNQTLFFSPNTDRDVLDYPDLNRFAVKDFVGVEYYTGVGGLPPEYREAPTRCGVLVLWTRD